MGTTNPHMRAVERITPKDYEKTYQGLVVLDDDDVLAVNVQGNILPARWADPLVVVEGDPVLVSITRSSTGLTEAIVTGRVADQPRPSRGTTKTVPVGSSTITVTGSDGIDYTATFVDSYTPVVGDKVILQWNASQPTVVGETASTAPAAVPSKPVPPPPSKVYGSTPYNATDSATLWGPGGWNSWAGGAGRVYQGSYGSGPLYGSWFYGGRPKQLAGRSISRIRFVLGSRLAVGSYNSPITLHIYGHTSASRPGGDVSRTVGPFNVPVRAGAGLGTYTLPSSFHSLIIAGGGISIAGEPYAGFKSRWEQPQSGQLIIDWSY